MVLLEVNDEDAKTIQEVAEQFEIPIPEVISVLCSEIDKAKAVIHWFKVEGLYEEEEIENMMDTGYSGTATGTFIPAENYLTHDK